MDLLPNLPQLEGQDKVKAINIALTELTNWKASQTTETPLSYEYGLQAVLKLYSYAGISSLAPLLGHLLSLKGTPMTLERHFVHEPLFERFNVPQKFLMKCGRQIGKSQSLSAQGIIQSTLMRNFNTIFICPLYEQIRRFSSNYVRPLITDSPIKSLIIADTLQAQNVLQRTLANGSIMFFTFCFLDVERVRGIAADKLVIDEVQDIDWDFLPVIEHCLSASTWEIKQFSGTPKTFDNTIQQLWEDSSQAEWVIPCDCGYWNTCTITLDLDLMIQRQGLSCRKCGRLVDSRRGHYEHMYPERRGRFVGYHIPQPILPIHYANENKWYKLFMQREKSKVAYYNECLGESCDAGTKLITLTDLQKACALPWKNSVKEALEQLQNYEYITMGVDWGGGAGGTIKRIKGTIKVEGGSPSFTVLSIVGFKPNSIIPELIYTERLNASFTPQQETQIILDYFRKFRCYRLAHDFGGSGSIREAMLFQAGLPDSVIFPCQYVRASSKNICVYQPPVNGGSRFYYSLDKARSLALLCQIIKADGGIRFPKCDWGGNDERYELVLRDFLSLIEDKHESVAGADVYLITRNPKQPDDFCHALNYACVAHWHGIKEYPNLAEQHGITLTDTQKMALDPNPSLEDWSSM
jgi:hypothetical protein